MEFIRILLNDLSLENNINEDPIAYKQLANIGKSQLEMSLEYSNYIMKREKSFITDIFYNQLIIKFKCICGYETFNFSKIFDIPILIGSDLCYKFEDLIMDNLKEDNINWVNKCDKCRKQNINHSKETKFILLNNIILFSLQRFDRNNNIKNESNIIYKEILDLNPFWDDSLLIGLIKHYGSIDFGHYLSFIKIKEIWYKFNDSIITKLENFKKNSKSVCIFIYEKIK